MIPFMIATASLWVWDAVPPGTLCIRATVSSAQQSCTRCGKPQKFGAGTCAACKLKKVPGLAQPEFCTSCGKQLKIGKGTCAECKLKKTDELMKKGADKLVEGTEKVAEGSARIAGEAAKVYDESRKSDLQRFVESPVGIASIVGGFLILTVIIMVVVRSSRKQVVPEQAFRTSAKRQPQDEAP